MTFGNWYRSKYPFIASEEEYARLNDAWEVAFEAGQANPPEGWKLVPDELLAIIRRLIEADSKGILHSTDFGAGVYKNMRDLKDMLAAAPTPGKYKS